MKSFPQPLTAAEEKYYMQKYTEGDLEAKHILIERNLRLVAHIVKKYQPPPEEMEDLLSIGTIGLMKAVVTFDPDKSARLASYAARCIENEVLMYLRGKKKSSKEVSLYEPIGTDREGNEIQLFDVIEMNEEDVYRRTKGDFYDETLQESKGYLRPRLCERDGQDPCVYREQPESYVHWYRRVCECLDSAGILHERDKLDPGQWSGTSCLQQRRIVSDSQRHLSRQGLWRNLQPFIFFFITHSPKRRCRILQRRKSKWFIWFTCLH